jgi:chromosome segregation ATPase
MSDPKLDAQLRAYLEDAARDKAEGNTIANLRLEVHQLRADMNELSTEQRLMKLRIDRHGRDIREIKQRIEWGDDSIGDTGQHQVEDLRRHLAAKEAELSARKDSGMWWRRKKREWLVAAVGAFVMLTLGGFGTITWFFITRVVLKDR